MSLLDLAELKNRPAKRSRNMKLVELLERLLGESLSVKELVTSLRLQPGVVDARYEKGSVVFGTNNLELRVKFNTGSVIEVEVPPAVSFGEEEWEELVKEMTEVTGVQKVIPSGDRLVIELDGTLMTPELVASVLAKLAYELWEETLPEEPEEEYED